MSDYFVKENKLGIAKIILASIIAVIVSLGLILIFALLIKWFNWSDNVITPVNIVIKLVSIAVGVLIATKSGEKRMLKGTLVGLSYVLVSFIVFSLLIGKFSFGVDNVWDLLLGVVGGGIIGIINNIIHK